MKKTTLLIAAFTSLLAVSALNAQTTTTTTTNSSSTAKARISASKNSKLTDRLRQIESQSTEVTTKATRGATVDGSVARAVRSGNPLQMINPFAPKEYGNGRDVTRHESDDPYQRAQGLQLASVQF